MKKNLLLLSTLLLSTVLVYAQPPKDHITEPEKPQQLPAARKFQVLVKNVEKEDVIKESNERFLELQSASNDRALGAFGSLLWGAYTSFFVQKTVKASNDLIDNSIKNITEAFKGGREKWYNAAKKQCHYNQLLTAESTISDFYALPSTKGAMDPENLKFEGFGCRNFIEVIEKPGEGVDIFYIFCKMRRDSVGLSHIINHSKFMVELDTLIFVPQYCNLPNDSTGGSENRFSFDKRDNLRLTLKVKIFSSWMNQATMIYNNELLGEFSIRVKIDSKKLNDKGQFVYNRNDPDFARLVSIEGDSYIVPRSFTGTTDAHNYQPTWGTGQYRVDMEVFEDCNIVDKYYQIEDSGKKKWDKSKWKAEWKAMNANNEGKSIWGEMWNCVVEAYKGKSWTATLTDPFTTSLYDHETTKLNESFSELREKLFPEEYESAFEAPAAEFSNKTFLSNKSIPK